jgi:hypothetical protein
MTEDELKQFGDLAKKFEDKDKDAVLKILKKDVHPVFQEINDGGRSAANADIKPKLEKAEKEAGEFKARAEKAENDLKELEGKAPDAAALRKKYEDDLKKERETLQGQIDAAKKETVEVRLENARQKLIDKLVSGDDQIDREYANTVIANRDDVKARIKLDEKNAVRVLKEGSQDLFIVPADGKDALDHLAGEIAGKVDDKWKGSKVRRGSNTTTGTGGSGTKNEFDEIRESVKGRSEERSKSREAGSGLDRLGGRTRSAS